MQKRIEKYIKLAKIGYILMISSFFAMFLFLILAIAVDIYFILLTLLTFVTLGVGVFMNIIFGNRVKDVLGEYIRSYGYDVRYDSCVNEFGAINLIAESNLIPNIRNDKKKFNDYFEGTIDGIGYQFFDMYYYYETTQTTGSGKNRKTTTQTHSILRGTFFKIYINLKVDCNIIIREKRYNARMGILNLPKIETESILLSEKFEIQTDSHELALRILKPYQIEALTEIEKMYKGLFSLSITNNAIYALVNDSRDHFEMTSRGKNPILYDFEKLISVVKYINKAFKNLEKE